MICKIIDKGTASVLQISLAALLKEHQFIFATYRQGELQKIS